MHEQHEQHEATSPATDARSVRGRLPWGRRRSRTPSGTGGRSRFERVLFSFMGPPQLGDLHAPVRTLPQVPVAPCPKCGQPYDGHEIVRDPRLTYTRCPLPPP